MQRPTCTEPARHHLRSTVPPLAPLVQVWLLRICVAVVVLALLALSSPRFFTNDSTQYWSVTRSILDGLGPRTTTLYYDTQLALGLPALQTIWPPGLPYLAATLARVTGIAAETATALLNALAHGSAALLLFWIVGRLHDSGALRLAVALGYLVQLTVVKVALSGGSEPLFYLSVIASAACVIKAFGEEDDPTWWLVAASASVAAGTLVRYPAVFQVAPLGLTAWYAFATARRPRSIIKAFASASVVCALPVIVFAGLLARNAMLTGSPTGSAGGPRATTLTEFASQVKWAIAGVLGYDSSVIAKLAILAIAPLALAILVATIRATPRNEWRPPRERFGFVLFSVISAITTPAIIGFLALRSVFYSLEPRYMVMPALMLLLALIALWPRQTANAPEQNHARVTGFLLVAAIATLFVGNSIDLARYFGREGETAAMQRLMQARVGDRTIEKLLAGEVSLASPVLSNQSQLLHVALERPTIGVPEYRLTPHSWPADAILAKARGLGAKYLLVFRQMPLGAADGSTDYVWRMAEAGHSGIVPLYESDSIGLYEILR